MAASIVNPVPRKDVSTKGIGEGSKPCAPKVTRRKHAPLGTGTQGSGKGPGRKAKSCFTKKKTKLAKGLKARKVRNRIAACSPSGSQRPLSGLDEQAKALGVYDEAYHCLNRKERKSIVSTALTKSKAA
jgi:hypothetical protein